VCLCEKKDYHKKAQGMIHQLRELLPLVEKAHLIERISEERLSRTTSLSRSYFHSLRHNLLTLVNASEADFLQKLKSAVSLSTLSNAEVEVVEHLKRGAYDQILPTNLAAGVDKIMNFELNEDAAALRGLHNSL